MCLLNTLLTSPLSPSVFARVTQPGMEVCSYALESAPQSITQSLNHMHHQGCRKTCQVTYLPPGCLALAELGRRGLLLPARLQDGMLPGIVAAHVTSHDPVCLSCSSGAEGSDL